MTHDELAESLANHLRTSTDRMVWTNIPMGAVGSIRPDVYTIAKSFNVTSFAYEVKVSVSDFRADVTAGKWRGYLDYACGVYFAAPSGLINTRDLPPGCGLIVWNGTGWKATKRPTLQKQPILPQELWVKLLMDGVEREVKRTQVDPRVVSQWRVQEAMRRQYGAEVAKALACRDGAAEGLRHATEMLERQRQDAHRMATDEMRRASEAADNIRADARAAVTQLTRDLALACGLQPEANLRDIRRVVLEIRTRLSRDAEVKYLRDTLDKIVNLLDTRKLKVDDSDP
jgi:hypothetical protein